MFLAQIFLNSLVLGTHVLLLAAGLYLVHTVCRVIHPAVGAIAVAGGYGYYLLAQLDLPSWLAVLGGLAIGVGASLASLALLRPFILRQQPLVALLASLAFGTALEAGIAIAFGSEGRFLASSVLPTFDVLGLRLTYVGLATLVAGAVIAGIAAGVLYLLPAGRILRAIAQHRETAEVLGIRQWRVQLVTFAVVGLICAIVGMLKGLQTAITPQAGMLPMVMGFLALIVGGMHDFRGVIVAAYLLVLVPELLIAIDYGSFSIATSWQLVLSFVLALILLLIRPRGLLATATRTT